ncbi:MAG: deoxyribose-phosphate aldolase [Candidatus Solibacter sp.]|nr:deoxyribose-phosphate aldolase [Candidatus Solibacter sp.]
MDYTYLQVAKMIDHSLLNPVLTDQELEAGCRLALEYDVASACVKPYYLKKCADLLAGSAVAASTVIGFPHGGHTTAVKVAEAEQALRDGGGELDMVVNVGKVLSEDWDYVRQDIQAVVEVTHQGGALVKVIFENCYLEDRHKIALCEICAEVGADFVKTSTGYGSGGATMADLQLMRKHSPPHVRVKAAGGIRTLDGLLEVRAIGVSRSGATRTAEMLTECRRRLNIRIKPLTAAVSARPIRTEDET